MFVFTLFDTDFASNTLDVASTFFGGLSPFVILVGGVLLATLVVVVLIKALHH